MTDQPTVPTGAAGQTATEQPTAPMPTRSAQMLKLLARSRGATLDDIVAAKG